MDNKADVKAIMARFQAGGVNSTEEASASPTGRHKKQLQPTLSSGPLMPAKKPVLESLSGSAVSILPKPNSLKGTMSTSSAPELQEPPKAKVLASKYLPPQEHSNSNSKPFANKPFPFKTPPSQDTGVKTPKPLLQKPSLASIVPESKPAFSKPSLGSPSNSKPSWVKENSGDSATPKVPPIQQKPSSGITKLRLQSEEGSPNKQSQTPVSRATSNFRAAQNAFNKDDSNTDQSHENPKEQGTNKHPLAAINSTPPSWPLASKKPSIVKKPTGLHQTTSSSGDANLGPPQNPLPNTLVLGSAPAKPNRPPKVNLEGFIRNADTSDNGSGPVKKTAFPPTLASHPSNQSNQASPPLPSNLPAPSLPPRHPATIIQPEQEEENYDDVGVMNSPPPLPPSAAHPSQRAKEQSDESDGDTYEDLDQQWEEAERKEQVKKREKEEREEKRRLEAEKKEKKEQKEREKKEQEAKKKFKLTGVLEVLHRATAVGDSKGSKMDLALKHGELVDILRLHGNPEGKWLGRTHDGSYGYVKTSSVEIERKKQEYDPDVYDDIDVASNDNVASVIKGPAVVLPPPVDLDGEIYDDVVDPSLEIRSLGPPNFKSSLKPRRLLGMFEWRKPPAGTNEVPPPRQFSTDKNSEPIDEEIYDDVDSQTSPPPPPFSSSPFLKSKLKMEEMDTKKQKKFEKEEKDFRKKFKYEGEIQVLYQVTIIPTMNNKKWNGKDLPIKPGEKLDVMVKAVDNKLICRNEEGKFGYVSTSHTVTDDGDIYDDIGDDSIYHNE